MMKKIFTLAVAMFAISAVMAQTIVSTQVEKRNVLIEEFTGVNCGYCPDGHYIANLICDYFYGHAWAINIHAGGYATGSGYTTTFGDGIHELFSNQIQGYPCGVVNRGSVQSRTDWASTADNIRNEDSPVNIAARGTLNVETRELSVHIEAYNTGSTDLSAYLLNVAVLQNNILGQQSNYGPYNTDYVEGNQYRHMHMLRDLLMGQWGVEISSAQNAFFDTTFVYTIPESISGLAIPDVKDIELVAYLTAPTHKNVITAAEVLVPQEMAKLHKLYVGQTSSCSFEYTFTVQIENATATDITSVTLNVDGTNATFPVNIASFELGEITLPSYTFEVSGEPMQTCSGTKTISLVSYVTAGGETVTVNGAAKSADFGGFNIYTVDGPITARIGLDCYRNEAGVSLVNMSNCETVWAQTSGFGDAWQGDNVSYVSQLPDAGYFDITFSPSESGLYIFRALDSYGDGWRLTNNTTPSGIWLSNAAGQFAAYSWGYTNGPTFSEYDIYLNITNNGDGSHNMGIDNVAEVVFGIYPNPTADRLNINCDETLREVSVIDMAGRTVINAGVQRTVNVSGLATGVYMVRVATENGIGIQKFVKE